MGGKCNRGGFPPGRCLVSPWQKATSVALLPRRIAHVLHFPRRQFRTCWISPRGESNNPRMLYPSVGQIWSKLEYAVLLQWGFRKCWLYPRAPPREIRTCWMPPPQENPDVMSPPHSNSQIWGSPLGRYARMEFPIATTIMKGFLGKRHHPAMNQFAIPLQLHYEQLA
jgi:hypothetical protein